MTIPVFAYTTTSAAIGKDDVEIALTSVTGIAKGDTLVIRGEAMSVDSATITTASTKVTRGVNGTRQKTHPTAKRVYHATPDEWKSIRVSTMGLLGDSGDLPEYLLPGQTATDDDGNEFLMIESTEDIYRGCTCVVAVANDYYTAAVLAAGVHGPVGVAAELIPDSNFGWLQIKGSISAQQAMPDTAATSAYYAVAATSISSPAAGLYTVSMSTTGVHVIHGMFLTGVSTSATTSVETGSQETGARIPVYLWYPYANSAIEEINTSNS